MRYGPIEATLDREQGANVWLTFAIREGKNREVRKVLETLGLKVNRLIRVAFGPFELGELAEGAVKEVEDGRRCAASSARRSSPQANADFDAPLVRSDGAQKRRLPVIPRRCAARQGREPESGRARRSSRDRMTRPARTARATGMQQGNQQLANESRSAQAPRPHRRAAANPRPK